MTDSAGLFINWVNDVVAKRAYSRKLEEEADAVGLELMATAGYDPRAALDLWELMSCVEADAARAGKGVSVEQRLGFLRTHPTSEERLGALKKDMEGAMRTWREHVPQRIKEREREKKEAEKESSAAVGINKALQRGATQEEASPSPATAAGEVVREV